MAELISPDLAPCRDPWHYPFVPKDERERRQLDERREATTCPTCDWRGSGWVCIDCGLEIPYEEIAFKPRCMPCHTALANRLGVLRRQKKIEDACFDERTEQRVALRHHREILKALDG